MIINIGHYQLLLLPECAAIGSYRTHYRDMQHELYIFGWESQGSIVDVQNSDNVYPLYTKYNSDLFQLMHNLQCYQSES